MEYQSERALGELAAFVAVVETGGFSAAARASGARKATLSQRIASLERRLGVPLLVRTTRSVRLTDEGRDYFGHARRALLAARDAEGAVAAARARPSGLLRVTVPTSLAGALLDAVVIPYMARYPEVTVHLDSSSQQVDLARERFDIAVRLGPLEDSGMVARRLGTSGGGYFASPRYLERQGEPRRPRELTAHSTIAVAREGGLVSWRFAGAGRRQLVEVRPRITVSSFELGARAAAADLGIVRAPLAPVQGLLQAGRLVRVLAEWSEPDAEVYAVLPPGGTSVPRTRAFLDMLAAWPLQPGPDVLLRNSARGEAPAPAGR